MKNTIFFLFALLSFCFQIVNGQSQHLYPNEKLAVVNVDVIGIDLEPRLAGEMLRRELMKLNLYKVADAYDQEFIMRKNNIRIDSCYSLFCLQTIGNKFESDRILTGSVTKINRNIIVTIKVFDVKTNGWDKMATESFNDLSDQLPMMMEFTLKRMLGVDYNHELYRRLTLDKSFYDNEELRNKEEANLSGPRLGVGFLTGTYADVMRAPSSRGGLESGPFLSHLGYQFEKVFISSGNMHALVEFLPILSGFEHNTIIPSANLLLGVRNSKNGLEFAMGYNAALTKVIDKTKPADDPHYTPGFQTGLIFAGGKTFKSGRLNFPINVYFIPGAKQSHRMGITMGFNIPRRNK
jgi:hypothetical protein